MSADKKAVYLGVGGSAGIGSAAVRQLIAQGASVPITGRNAERLAAAGAETGAQTFALEARDSEAVESVFREVHAAHGRVDGVVNCAGSVLLKPAHRMSDSEFAETIGINRTSAFNVLRAAVRIMMHQPGGGGVALCSSVAAKRGLMNHEAIAAAKAGAEGLALAAAASYARDQVRVNCVAPGLTRTGPTRSLTRNEAVAKASAALHPLGRIGEPAEVASAICWLLDRALSRVTGQVIGADGGLGRVQARG